MKSEYFYYSISACGVKINKRYATIIRVTDCCILLITSLLYVNIDINTKFLLNKMFQVQMSFKTLTFKIRHFQALPPWPTSLGQEGPPELHDAVITIG